MINQKSIRELQNKDAIDHYFLLRKFEKKQKKDGSYYVLIEVADKTGSITGNFWEGFENFLNEAFVGAIVKVRGSVELFNEKLQLRIDSISLTTKDDKVELSDLMPTTIRDIEVMREEFWSRIRKIQNEWLKQLLKKIFTKDRFERFAFAPAGKSFHHNYIGGLLEHTLEVVKICDLMCDISESSNFQPTINRDLLITGAMLHDIGKIEELTYDTIFDYSDKGRLIGHIVIAANWIYGACNQIPHFPEELQNLILHLVLSHQGKLENASPVEPKTLEAIILYYADELSAKTNAYRQIISGGGEMNSNWTKYHYLIQSSLFVSKEPDYYLKNQSSKNSNSNDNEETSGGTLFD
ncbi:MAG: HD domain-containing protein [Ignavibacteria bacterium]|nr:HD domain-containing protein [Ignavibacteria bacterium]